jgi:hypothetical protein
MKKYTQQLFNDLEQKILIRWQEQPPHFYGTGMPNMYLEPPEGWSEAKYDYEKVEIPKPSFEVSIGEMEQWLEQAAEDSMFYKMGLLAELFPPVSMLTDEEVSALVLKLLRLWAAHNFAVTLPDLLPNSLRYETLLKRMLEPAMFAKHGLIGIEFCYFNAEDCPFPEEYCGCRDF